VHLELTPEAVGGWLKPGDVVELTVERPRHPAEPGCGAPVMTYAEQLDALRTADPERRGREVAPLRNPRRRV
jgi:hypothetical protein